MTTPCKVYALCVGGLCCSAVFYAMNGFAWSAVTCGVLGGYGVADLLHEAKRHLERRLGILKDKGFYSQKRSESQMEAQRGEMET